MSFAWPLFLWLLPLPFLLLLVGLLRARRGPGATGADHILRGEAGSGRLKLGSSPGATPGRRARPLLCLAAAGLLLGLARPQWGVIEEPVYSSSREILIGFDLSRSMLATDIKPSRLERSKLLVQSLLDRLRGERIGLVVFSGTAFLQSPLSSDYEILRDLLPSLGPDYLPEGGTAYRALLRASLDAFSKTPNTDRFLIILSDGEALDDDWKPLVAELKERQVRVLGLGVGTAGGSLITDEKGALVKDERGAAVLTRLEPATLESLARDTGGRYREAGTWIDLSALVRETVETGRTGETVERQKVRLVERFQWPLAFALACGLLSLAMEFPGRIRPRQLRIQGATTKTAALLVAGLLLCQADRLEAAAPTTPVVSAAPSASLPATVPAAEKPAEPALVGTVRRLCELPSLDAEGCRSLAEDTLAWGTNLRTTRQAFPPGPINDGIEATELGEKLDPKLANWKLLREQLRALLQPTQQDKDQQKQEQKSQENRDQQKKEDEKKEQQQKEQDKNQEQQSNKDQKPQDKSSEPPQDQKQQQTPEASKGKPGEKQEAFGKMPPPPPPAQQEEMQQVGGAPQDKQPADLDPNLVVPLEKLQKLKAQDNPGRLFELMQDEKETPPSNKKNW
jgi:Ca-activated chloride channel family protein